MPKWPGPPTTIAAGSKKPITSAWLQTQLDDARGRPFSQWECGRAAIVKEFDQELYAKKLKDHYDREGISSVVNNRLNASSDHSAARISTTSVILPSASMPVFPWVAGATTLPAAGDWEDYFNEMEKYEATGLSYQRKNLTSSQTVFMNNIMSTAEHFQSDVTLKEWADPLVVTTNKWRQAVRTVSSSSGLPGETPFALFKRMVKKEREFSYLNVMDTISWTTSLETTRSNVLLTAPTTIEEERELIKGLKESLAATLANVNGFGMEARVAFKDLIEAERNSPNPKLDNVLGEIRIKHIQMFRKLQDVQGAFSKKVLSDALALDLDSNKKRSNEKVAAENEFKKQNVNKDHPGKSVSKPLPSTTSQGGGDKPSLKDKLTEKMSNWGKVDTCVKCGNQHTKDCYFDTLPPGLSNQTSTKWHESDIGRCYYQLGYPTAWKINPRGYDPATKKLTSDAKIKFKLPSKLYEIYDNNSHYFRALCNCVISQNKRSLANIKVLLDTGAEFNTVSSILVKKYKLNMIDALIGNGLTNIATQLTACGAIKGSECIPITKLIKLKITHEGTSIPTYEESFYVGEFEEDIIIGLPTLKRFNILLGYPDIFFSLPTAVLTQLNGELSANSKAQIEPTGLVGSGQKRKVSDHTSAVNDVAEDVQPLCSNLCTCNKFIGQEINDTNKHIVSSDHTDANDQLNLQQLLAASFQPMVSNNEISKDMLLPRISSISENYSQRVFDREDIYEIPENKLEAIPSELIYVAINAASNIPSQIFGSSELQERLKLLLNKYASIFSRHLRTDPARLTPFKFEVDLAQWHDIKNRTGRRKYDLSRQEELKKIIVKLLEAGVIRPSRAAYYSHGFVVPKSTTGQWRLVVDYKNLNKICSTEKWLVPNMKEILQRIGDKRPRIFNVMD